MVTKKRVKVLVVVRPLLREICSVDRQFNLLKPLGTTYRLGSDHLILVGVPSLLVYWCFSIWLQLGRSLACYGII